MADENQDDLSSTDNKSDSTSGVPGDEKIVPEECPDRNGVFDRRSVLKLAGSTVAASGLVNTAVAATTRGGITFDTVLDAVDDLDMDSNGSTPINLGSHIASNTLIEFPPGEYLVDSFAYTGGIENFGIRGTGSSHTDVQLVPPRGSGVGVLAGGGPGPYLVENLSLQERDDDSSALWFGLGSNRGVYMADVEWLGRSPSDIAADSDYHLNVDVYDQDAVSVFENVRAGLDLPSTSEVYPDGIAFIRTGPSHRGEVIMRNCVIHERNSTATRFEAGPGVVTMEGCEFVNNQLTHIRVGGGDHPSKNTVIRDCYVEVDGSRDTTAGIQLEDSWPNPAIFENVHIEWANEGSRGVIASPSYQPHGPAVFRDCVVHNDAGDSRTVNFAASDVADDAVTIENCTFTGTGGGFTAEDRPGSVIRDSCIDMPNASIDGFDTQALSTSGCDGSDGSNSGPAATITVTGTDGLTVDLSGSDSSDPDGEIVAYEWSVDGETYTGSQISHTFQTAGTHDVSLTVEDDEGATASTTSEVTVEESLPRKLELRGTGTSTNYEFTVSGSLAEADGSLQAWDEIDGSTASGWVTGSSNVDAFTFSGEVTSFEFLQGEAAVYLDGSEVDPSTFEANTLEFVGTGTPTNYEFTVSGSLAEADGSLQAWDEIDGSTASGWVTGSSNVDAYSFTGEITSLEFLQGEATVYLDGTEMDLDDQSSPTIDRYDVTEAGSPNPHANVTVVWDVSDDDGDLSDVTVEVIDEGGSVVDSATTSVDGDVAYDVDYFEIKNVDGQSLDVRTTVVDGAGNQSSATRTVQE